MKRPALGKGLSALIPDAPEPRPAAFDVDIDRLAPNIFQPRQDDIADAVGKDRATVANTLRLLKLPDEVRAEVAAGTLSMGHARALLALPTEADQRRVGRDVIVRALSVRETETLVKKIV